MVLIARRDTRQRVEKRRAPQPADNGVLTQPDPLEGALMNKSTEMQLLGQLAADALVRDALLIALMEVIPNLHARLEAKVAVAAPCAESQLPLLSLESFQERLAEVRGLLSNAYPTPDDARGLA